MCSLMLICQCCFATVKVLLKKVTYLLTYLGPNLCSTMTGRHSADWEISLNVKKHGAKIESLRHRMSGLMSIV